MLLSINMQIGFLFFKKYNDRKFIVDRISESFGFTISRENYWLHNFLFDHRL